MIDKGMISNKIILIQKDLTELQKYTHLKFNEISKDYLLHKGLERIIEVIINEAIDINQHLIVQSDKRKLPFDFKQSFLLLADLGVYPIDFGNRISDSAGLRNILVHEYRELDEEIFYNSIRQCFEEYTRYCKYILAYTAVIS